MHRAYIVIQFTHPDRLIPAVEQLSAHAAIESWEALHGQAQLVLVAREFSPALMDNLRQMNGLEEIVSYEIADGESRSPSAKPLAARAYLFLDTMPGQKEAVAKAILALPETVSCAAVKGGCDLIALIQGETIASVEQAMDRDIRTLDGVLRLKCHHAINLKQL